MKNELEVAINDFLQLSSKFHETMWKNYFDPTLVRLFPIGGKPGVDVFSLQCGGSGMMKIAPCGWEGEVEVPHTRPQMELTPGNRCPDCGNGIVVVHVAWDVGAMPPERYEARPIPETQKEYDRVSLEQHQLHVRVYEARQRVLALTTKAAA